MTAEPALDGRSVVSGCAKWFGPNEPLSRGHYGEYDAGATDHHVRLAAGLTPIARRFCTRPLGHAGACDGPILLTVVG